MKTKPSIILSNYIRAHSLKMVHEANASHIGGSLSISDILAVLYEDILIYDPKNIKYEDRDRFILSKGHCCSALYATLALKDFFSINNLSKFTKFGSDYMSHVSHKVKGVEFSTGSLGHGLPFAVGKALASKLKKKNWEVFVLLSDGELNEGSNWEALMFASHHKLDNLTVIIDYNKLQSLTTIEKTLRLEPLKKKFDSFGCCTFEIDGHNHYQLNKYLSKKFKKRNKPKIIIANTIKGKGVSFMENEIKWHYKSPDKMQLDNALKQIGLEI